MRRPKALVQVWALVWALAGSAALGQPLEADLAARWEGRAVVARTSLYSDCFDHYTVNRLHGGEVEADSGRRFDPGELGTLRELLLEPSSVRLRIDLDETLLAPYPARDFTVWLERACKVEIQLARPTPEEPTPTTDALDGWLLESLARFAGPEEARASELWNRRHRDPFPPGYAEALAAYRGRIDRPGQREALALLARIVRSMGQVPDEAADFAAGMGGVRERLGTYDCDRLAQEAADLQGQLGDSAFDRGQALVTGLEALRRFEDCDRDPGFPPWPPDG